MTRDAPGGPRYREHGNEGNGRGGFSLLEVILALAVLTGAIAVLGEAVRLGMRNAEVSRETTQAQLLCESKLAEITAGITSPDPVPPTVLETAFDEPGEPSKWLYSITRADTEEVGLDLICVTVAQNLAPEKRPVEFSLFRWIPETGAESSEETAAESLGTGATSD